MVRRSGTRYIGRRLAIVNDSDGAAEKCLIPCDGYRFLRDLGQENR